MTNQAIEAVKAAYDLDTCRQIADQGVDSIEESDVFLKQAIEFFDKYEKEINSYIIEKWGKEMLEALAEENKGLEYKRVVTLCFIEFVAGDIVQEEED